MERSGIAVARGVAVLALVAWVAVGCGGGGDDGLAGGAPLGVAGAHEHDVARVNVVVEGNGAIIEFVAPADGVYGFEHEPTTDGEREARDAGFALLRDQTGLMLVFDPGLGCRIEDLLAAADAQPGHGHAHDDGHEHDDPHEHDEGHGHDDGHGDGAHREVRAEFRVTCGRSPVGTEFRLAVTDVFPRILQVDLQVLTDSGQRGARVRGTGVGVRL